MRYVILRDDDTNPLMRVEFLERLYRPFLDRGLPVNLATIPNVASKACYPDGRPEFFLMAKEKKDYPVTVPLKANADLVCYLRTNPLFHLVQHGCRHEFVRGQFEFNQNNRADVIERLEEGLKCFQEAGFPRPETFVAPYDQLSQASLEEVTARFGVLSTGWFEWRRLPVAWWPRYLLKKAAKQPHWRVGNRTLLSHPGCLLSFHKPYHTILDNIKSMVQSQNVTVLVTHWWEYFRENTPDEAFISVLHQTADYLASDPEIRVITFGDLLKEKIPLH